MCLIHFGTFWETVSPKVRLADAKLAIAPHVGARIETTLFGFSVALVVSHSM